MEHTQKLLHLAYSSQLLYCMRTICLYNIPDLIQSGKNTAKALAEATGLHERALYRVIRATAVAGIVKYDEENQSFELAETGQYLRSDHPQSLTGMFVFLTMPVRLEAFAKFNDMVTTGTNCLTLATGGHLFDHCAKDEEIRKIVDNGMSTFVAGMLHNLMGDEVPLAGVKVLLDVGGGNGKMCLRLLNRNPGLKTICFDLPHVVAGATVKHDDLEFASGDFFKAETLPQGRADAAILCTILHDWNDEECITILKSVRGTLPKGGKLFVSDYVITEDPNFALILDIEMLLLLTGQERTAPQVTKLANEAGFDFVKHYPSSHLAAVLEFVAV